MFKGLMSVKGHSSIKGGAETDHIAVTQGAFTMAELDGREEEENLSLDLIALMARERVMRVRECCLDRKDRLRFKADFIFWQANLMGVGLFQQGKDAVG